MTSAPPNSARSQVPYLPCDPILQLGWDPSYVDPVPTNDTPHTLETAWHLHLHHLRPRLVRIENRRANSPQSTERHAFLSPWPSSTPEAAYATSKLWGT